MTDEEWAEYKRKHTTLFVLERISVTTAPPNQKACYYHKSNERADAKALPRYNVSLWVLCKVVDRYKEIGSHPDLCVTLHGHDEIYHAGGVRTVLLPYGLVRYEMVCLSGIEGYLGVLEQGQAPGELWQLLEAYEKTLEPEPLDKVGLLVGDE